MSSLKNRLYNYEQAPPPKLWEKITSELDESHIGDQFPSKIYNAEAMPPVSAWDKIASALDVETAPLVPMRNRSQSLFRYAAAVAVIGIITFSVLKWNSGKDPLSNSQGISSAEDTIKQSGKNIPAGNDIVTSGQNTSTTGEGTSVDIAREIARPAQPKKTKTNYSIPDNIDTDEPIYAYNEHTPNLSDRYVMLMTPNGIVRMSKKLGNMICCVAGEEQDEGCRDQIKKWQEKLASSPVAAAPGNFMDIISLVNTLNEGEDL